MSGPWFKNMMTGRGQSSRSSAPQSGTTPPSSPPPHTRYATQPTDQYDLKKPTTSSHMLPQMTQSWASQGVVSPEPPQAVLAPHQSPESALSSHAQSTPQPLPSSAAPSQPASSHGQRPPAARTMTVATALRTIKRIRSALRETANELEPLASALDAFLAAWNGYQRTAEVQEGFTGLASRLEALDDFAVKWTEENEQKPANPDLQQRLAALQEAVKQLTTAFAPKQDRSPLAQAVQGLGDVMVVDLLFRRVASLLQAFQLEGQITAESPSSMTLQLLGTAEQRQLTNMDAVRAMLEHINGQHGHARNKYDAIVNHIERGTAAAASNEGIINNNSNENQVIGDAHVVNNNSNENEYYGEGGTIENNNSNVNYAYGTPSPGSGSSSGMRIENNNGNINRMFGGGASPAGWPFGPGSPFNMPSPPFGGPGSPFAGGNSPFGGAGSPFSGASSPFSSPANGFSSPHGGSSGSSGRIINNNGNKNFMWSPPSWTPNPSTGRRLDE